MKILPTTIVDVRQHPNADRLTIVTLDNGFEVVANLQDDGTPRWTVGEVCIYIPENAVIPDDVLQERGYWDDVKSKGLLAGSKGNRVKMQRFVGFESRGLIFKTYISYNEVFVRRESLNADLLVGGEDHEEVLRKFLGITEYVAK